MRAAILTFHRAYNCGAMLQAWALQEVLQRAGHSVEFPDCNHVGDGCHIVFWRRGILGKIRNLMGWLVVQHKEKWLSVRRKIAFTWFMNKALNHRRFKSWSRYDVIVVGSDQVWNPLCAGNADFPLFVGAGIDAAIPLVGYAVSAGDKPLSKETVAVIRDAARNRFRSVSFREECLKEALGLDGPVVCDPTLLLDRDDYRTIEKKRRLCKEPYLFAYVVSDAQEVLAKAKEVAGALGIRLIVADVYRGPSENRSGVKNDCWALTPDAMLTYIRDAKYVIVSSFHGCVISALYQKPFVCLFGSSTGDQEQAGRQQTLLAKLGLMERRLNAKSVVADVIKAINVPYDVSKQLSAMRTMSMNHLLTSI